jgi:hypothetical protein
MIHVANGDILKLEADALVNTVNFKWKEAARQATSSKSDRFRDRAFSAIILPPTI